MAGEAVVDAPGLARVPENLLREPVEYLLAEHFRQQEVCRMLAALAGAPEPGALAATVAAALRYLAEDLPLHIADEEQDLFRCLRGRCLEEDGLGSILGVLNAEHERDETLAATLVADLRELAAGRAPADMAAFRHAAAVYSETQRRHVAWENGVLLPLARRRLTPVDWIDLGRRMAARRGIDYPD